MHANLVRKRLFSLPEPALYLGRSTWSVRRLNNESMSGLLLRKALL